LMGCYAFGAWRLDHYEPSYHKDVEVRIVQPDIPQDEKWSPDRFDENLDKHLKLSRGDSNAAKTTYIIWPETSLSFRYMSDTASALLIKEALQSYEGDAYLLTGFFRYYPEE